MAVAEQVVKTIQKTRSEDRTKVTKGVPFVAIQKPLWLNRDHQCVCDTGQRKTDDRQMTTQFGSQTSGDVEL